MIKRLTALAMILVFIAIGTSHATAETTAENGIVATFNLANGFIELQLVDSKTRNQITHATIDAVALSPSGKKIKVKLVPMKMGASNSFMNAVALEMKEQGGYRFVINVETAKKKAKFEFMSAGNR